MAFNINTEPTIYSSVFRPMIFAGDVQSDKVVISGTPTSVRIEINAAAIDGNCVGLISSNLFDCEVGDMIYIMAGPYKGYHKIYFKDFGGVIPYVFLNTPFVATDTNRDIHSVNNNPVILKYWDGAAYTEFVRFYPTIKLSDNTFNFDIAGYLLSRFGTIEKAPDGATPTKSVKWGYDISGNTLTGSYAFYATINHSVYSTQVESATAFTKPMASSLIVFTNYDNILPWFKSDGIYEIEFQQQGNNDVAQWFADAGITTTDLMTFTICELCETNGNALNFYFLNKYGAFQNYVCFGPIVKGRNIDNSSTYTTAYPEKLKIGNPGDIYETIEVNVLSVSKLHRDLIVELIESPIVFIHNDDTNTETECVIEKKSFRIFDTTEETFNIRFNLTISEKILVQSR